MRPGNRSRHLFFVLISASLVSAGFGQVNSADNRSKPTGPMPIPQPVALPQPVAVPRPPAAQPVQIPTPTPLPAQSPTLPTPTNPGQNLPIVPTTPTMPGGGSNNTGDFNGDQNDRHHHHRGNGAFFPTDPLLYLSLFNNSTDYSNGYYPPNDYPPANVPNAVVLAQPAPAPAPAAPAPPDAANVTALMNNAVNNAPEMAAANQAVRQAQAALDKAKIPVLKALQQQPDFEQALQRRKDAETALKMVRRNGNDPNDVMSSAQAKLEAGDDVTRMEEKAISEDPTAAAAKKQLDDAIAKRDRVRAQLQTNFLAAY